ncbi:dTDP-glucose 4,6-dehydratase [Methanocella paludicola SANAE]|uniref:dTDP-glucose 4,6-dehydratase n=1 Tax=Methanocella paludicola (strain DSM 17711 / JCM 13418 / NBRC 101707 / SANAE) TaxID=304371 RepID=D1Z267_METPS|nr:dTDP-glucose 4,6-dehydratase [Methanocella paludicola]BAI62789.1 dTDP-glucose 4,6-dehydratase [Methanocella paludicola SANAE]
MSLMVTGAAGFIGANFAHFILNKHPGIDVLVYDKLTYAGNLDNLKDIRGRIKFVKGDICDAEAVGKAIKEHGVDEIINFAAETHVDRSIDSASDFLESNVKGVYTMLEAARKYDIKKLLQISTDEVYGSIQDGSFYETSNINPSNPYSAAKAAGDLLARSYYNTYRLPVLITRSSNNFGPYQFPEKLIPLMILKAMRNEPLPVYGTGMNVRDWIYVEDNCAGIDTVFHKGRLGEVYNIGGGNEKPNLEVVRLILKQLGKPGSLITFVKDRPGHDLRYSLNSDKTKALGWKPAYTFEDAMKKTIDWYVNNEWWWRPLLNK